MRSRRVTAGPSRTRGLCSCSDCTSMPAALRMWLDSLRALVRLAEGEEQKGDGDAGGPHDQSPPPVVRVGHDVPEDEDAQGLGDGVGEVVPAEDAAASLGGVGVREIGVVHRVVHGAAHRREEIEDDEPPHIGRQCHEGRQHGEDEKRHARYHLATAPVRPQPEWHGPQQLRHRGHEGHRPQSAVVEVEGLLEVVADQVDAIAEHARDDGGQREEDEGGVPGRAQDPPQGRRLPLADPRHQGDVGHCFFVAALADGLLEQLVGDGEAEQRRVPAVELACALPDEPLPHVRHRTATLIPDAIVRHLVGNGRRPRGPAGPPLAVRDERCRRADQDVVAEATVSGP